MQVFTEEKIAAWYAMVGQRVWKNPKTTSKFMPKPFKSGLQVNTVTGVVQHPYTPNLAFTFAEDESTVECFRCSIAPDPNKEPT